METRARSIHQIVDQQVKKWEIMRREKEEEKSLPVITVSREPGSKGRLVAEGIAGQLGLDLFHREIILEMAENAQISSRLLESLDERGLSFLEDWISTLVNEKHLWPDQYLKHLMRVVGTIGKHGQAIIMGRGANFMLPPNDTFGVRIIAHLDLRIENVSREFGVTAEEARRRVLRTESDRRAFVRKYFHADITDPANYDLVINTGTLSIDAAVGAIKGALGQR